MTINKLVATLLVSPPKVGIMKAKTPESGDNCSPILVIPTATKSLFLTINFHANQVWALN